MTTQQHAQVFDLLDGSHLGATKQKWISNWKPNPNDMVSM